MFILENKWIILTSDCFTLRLLLCLDVILSIVIMYRRKSEYLSIPEK